MSNMNFADVTIDGNNVIAHLYHVCQKYDYALRVVKWDFTDTSYVNRPSNRRFECVLAINELTSSAFGPNKKAARQLASFELIKLLVKKKPQYNELSDNEYNALMKVSSVNKSKSVEYESSNYIAILNDKLIQRQGGVLWSSSPPEYSFREVCLPPPSPEQLRTPLFVNARSKFVDSATVAFECSCLVTLNGVQITGKSWPTASTKAAKKHAAYTLLNKLTDNEYKVADDFPTIKIKEVEDDSLLLQRSIEDFNNLDIRKEYELKYKHKFDPDLDTPIVCGYVEDPNCEIAMQTLLEPNEVRTSLEYYPNTNNIDFERNSTH